MAEWVTLPPIAVTRVVNDCTAVAWKRGIKRSMPFCASVGSGAGKESPRRRMVFVGPAAAFIRLVRNCRLVDATPFGNPADSREDGVSLLQRTTRREPTSMDDKARNSLVPLVKKMVAISSCSIAPTIGGVVCPSKGNKAELKDSIPSETTNS